jgi:hypothetical protein
VAVETTQTVGDADPGAKDKSCALVEHVAGEAERYHQVLQWMLDEHPYLACQLSVFYHHAHRGIPRGGEFVDRMLLRSGTRRFKV